MAGVDRLGPERNGQFRMIACPTISHERRTDRYFESGRTVKDCLDELGWRTDGLHARVFIDGRYIPDAEWWTTEPQPGQAVVVRRVLRGGGGQGGGKQIGMLVGMLVIMAAAYFVGGGALASFLPEALQMLGTPGGWQIAGAVVGIGGALALNALVPPPRPKLGALSGADPSSAYALTGVSNNLTPYGRIPRVYGRHRMYPPLAIRPYTEIVGNQQFMRMVFCFGYGPLDLSDVRIGDTPIDEYEHTKEVLYGYPDDPPLSLVPDDIIEESMSLLLKEANGFQTRTTAANCKEISIDISFPEGITRYDGSNRPTQWSVSLDIQYRKVGDTGAWTLATGTPAASATATTNFTGVNNDLLFTVIATGPDGNKYALRFVNGASLSVQRVLSVVQDLRGGPPQTFPTDTFEITLVHGSTTAAAVKSACDAHADFASIFTTANAPGNDGTGAINLPLVVWNDTIRGGVPQQFSTFLASYTFSGGKVAVADMTVTALTSTLVRKNLRFPVNEPGQQFDVRVRRVTLDTHPLGDQLVDTTYWTMLRTVQTGSPITKRGMCLYALRIKATDQLNGTVDTFNAIATSVLPDWDGTNWVVRKTSNPASIYRDILQGTANRRPKGNDRLDLATIQAFHQRCAANGFEFNAVIDFETTVKQLRQDVLAAGRATYGLRDGKYSVIEDLLQTAPVDVITPRTSSNFKWTKRFVEMPHAFRVRFVDELIDWKQGEVIVYADGYDALSATIYEDVEAGLGVTKASQAVTMKRRELAEALLRADDYSVEMDFANLNVTRGDRVKLQHDVILAGLGSARIKSVTLNGSNEATAIAIDEPITMVPDTRYAVRVRRADGVQVVQELVLAVGEQTTVTFLTPIAPASVPSAGDLVVFGVFGAETIDCIVKNIEPGPDWTATIMLLDYAPAIQTAELGALPTYDPQITLPSEIFTPVPTIVQVVSNETVLIRDLDGALQSRILISVHFSSGFRLPVSKLETQFRVTGSDDEWKTIFTNVSGTSVEVAILPVEDGLAYDIRLRSVDDVTKAMSPWAAINGHVVVGKTTAPPDVGTVLLEGTRLRWNYPDPPRDHAGFLVRTRQGSSREWASAQSVHDQIIQTTDFQVLVHPGLNTYLVKAVDVAGNESTAAAALTIDRGAMPMANVMVTTDHRALGWPGTITNASIVSGDLAADTAGTFWTSDSAPAWPLADGDLYWNDGGEEMIYEFSVSPPADMLDATLKIQIEMLGEWRLEYRVDSSSRMWDDDATTPMWKANAASLMWSIVGNGVYVAAPAEISPLRYSRYDFRIIGSAGTVRAVLQQLIVTFDVIDVAERLPSVAIAPGGTRLALSKSYRNILVVVPTLVADGGTAAYARAMDKDVSSGPLIQAFDSVNAPAGATVDVLVQGY